MNSTEARTAGFATMVGRYTPKRPAGRPRGDQCWSTFLRNHAKAIVACDFLVSVTATFRLLYVFVLIEHDSRRLELK
jgi:putative transposase